MNIQSNEGSRAGLGWNKRSNKGMPLGKCFKSLNIFFDLGDIYKKREGKPENGLQPSFRFLLPAQDRKLKSLTYFFHGLQSVITDFLMDISIDAWVIKMIQIILIYGNRHLSRTGLAVIVKYH